MSKTTPTLLTPELAGKPNDRFASTLTLARWRLRQTGWLLFIACLGFVAAMIIACIVPLFTTVAGASSLQSILQANPARNDITLSVNTQGLNSEVASTVQQQVTPLVQQKFGPYQDGAATMAIQEANILGEEPASLQHAGSFSLYATPLASLKPHLHLISGRWPVGRANVLEIVLTPQTAQALQLSLGAQLTIQGNFSYQNGTGGPIDRRTAINAQLVGLFEVQAPAPVTLHGQYFQPTSNGATTIYTMLTEMTAFLHILDQTAVRLHADAIFSYQTFQLTWDYRLQTRNLQPDQVADLTNRLFTTQTDTGNYQNNQQQLGFGALSFPYITHVALYSPAPASFELLDLLQQYSNRTTLVSIPITILAVQIIALLIFFVSVLIGMLLDRQMAVNAMLSSRGASGKQIFWSLFFQGLALCIAGVVLGPLTSVAIVSIIAARVLPAGSVPIVQNILVQPLQILSSVSLAASGTLLAALLTIGLIVRYTSGLNMLTLRRETARITRPPFWQRYYLDVLAAVIALSGYGVSLYLANIAHEVDITTQDLILAPLTLIAPIFLLLGCLLLFLRVFPWLLRFGSWAANRRRGATTMLALVQMARSPRQIMRMTLLLSLTVAFAIFAQVFSASQAQRISDISAYEAGADFSGDLSNQTNVVALQHLAMSQVIARYSALPGVLAASADYTDQSTTVGSSGGTVPIRFRAVDSQSFARTVIWNTQDSSQSLSSLLNLLSFSGQTTLPGGLSVRAIVDQALASQLRLSIGDSFALALDNLGQSTLNYQVAAIVAHIPTINSSVAASSSTSPGGMLVDYRTFAGAYVRAIEQQEEQSRSASGSTPSNSSRPATVPVNHIWLRTRDDTSALTSLHAALTSSNLVVNNLYDRREIATELQADPFNINILLILSIGGLTAFLLAFIGDLVSSWLSVRTRRSSFVVLRALGATSRQVAGVLLWEQGIVYLGAILLGLAFGIVLASVAVPVLVFTGLPQTGPMSALNISDLYLLQHALPPQIVVPFSLELIFAALVLICIVALITMIRAALRPSISNELRLAED